METIVIDENFEGVYKKDWYFAIDIDIDFPSCHIDIKIPLVSSKSIIGKSLKVGEWLKVGKSLKDGMWREYGKGIEVFSVIEVCN